MVFSWEGSRKGMVKSLMFLKHPQKAALHLPHLPWLLQQPGDSATAPPMSLAARCIVDMSGCWLLSTDDARLVWWPERAELGPCCDAPVLDRLWPLDLLRMTSAPSVPSLTADAWPRECDRCGAGSLTARCVAAVGVAAAGLGGKFAWSLECGLTTEPGSGATVSPSAAAALPVFSDASLAAPSPPRSTCAADAETSAMVSLARNTHYMAFIQSLTVCTMGQMALPFHCIPPIVGLIAVSI